MKKSINLGTRVFGGAKLFQQHFYAMRSPLIAVPFGANWQSEGGGDRKRRQRRRTLLTRLGSPSRAPGFDTRSAPTDASPTSRDFATCAA